MRMAGTFRPRNAVMRRRNGTMQAHGRVGRTDDGAYPARHRGDATHGRAGRDVKSGPKQAKVAAIRTEMAIVRRRVALMRRRTASSGCMVAPARRIDAAIGTKCPGDASAWSRWRDGQWGLSVGMARGYGCMVGGAGSMVTPRPTGTDNTGFVCTAAGTDAGQSGTICLAGIIDGAPSVFACCAGYEATADAGGCAAGIAACGQ